MVGVCPHCNEDFSKKPGMANNKSNFQKHKQKCKQKKRKGNIASFFTVSKKPCPDQASSSSTASTTAMDMDHNIVSSVISSLINVIESEELDVSHWSFECDTDHGVVPSVVSEELDVSLLETDSYIPELDSSLQSFTSVVEIDASPDDVEYLDTDTSHFSGKCQGVVVDGISTHECLPLLLLTKIKVIVENQRLHHVSCYQNGYQIMDGAAAVNVCCREVLEMNFFQDIVTNARNDKYHLTTVNNCLLSHNQLGQRITNYRRLYQKQRLICFNQSKQINRLNKTLSLHQRLLTLIQENDIRRLHQIVVMALRNRRSISYILIKVTDAVSHLYNPQYTQYEKDIAFLILQFGGPGLLDICHRALNLPSESTGYRMLKGSTTINTSLQVTPAEVVQNVRLELVSQELLSNFGHMLKIDETFVDQKIKWCPLDNSLYGFCYEHGRNFDLTFSSYENVKLLAEAVDSGELHIAKECMVMAVGRNHVKTNSQVALVWPTCSKDEVTIQANMVKDVSTEFKKVTGEPFMNWATDGDNIRRQIFDSLMDRPLSSTSNIYPVLSKLALLDLEVGENEETVDFDAKHLGKRMRNTMIKRSFTIGKVTLTNIDMEGILLKGVTTSTRNSVKAMMNPRDKQNVGLATEFLLTFVNAVQNCDIGDISFRVSSVAQELRSMSYIIEGLLCLYVYVGCSIQDQLLKISTASHLFLVFFRELKGTFLPTQLYHDLQSTFKNAYFCAAKFQWYMPDMPLFLMLLGTDLLERIFGNIRLKYGLNALDTLELIYCTRAMRYVQQILDRHPDWVKSSGKVMSRLSLDYSKPTNWDQDKLKLREVDIHKQWQQGRMKAEQAASEVENFSTHNSDFTSLALAKVMILKPFGKGKVGLKPRKIDWSLEEFVEDFDAETSTNEVIEQPSSSSSSSVGDDEDGVDDSQSIIDYIEEPSSSTSTKIDNQIMIDGKYHYKASVIRQIFNSNSMSRDRLKRVQGLSKYMDDDKKVSDLEDVLVAGDPLLVMQTRPMICTIREIKAGGKKQKYLNGDELQKQNVTIEVQQISYREEGDKLIWSGSCTGNEFVVPGKSCRAFQPDVEMMDGKHCHVFSKSLMMDIGVGFINETHPGDTPRTKKNVDPSVIRHECFICKRNVELSQMRTHVGKHILLTDIKTRFPCGYCGRDACDRYLKWTGSKKHGQKVIKAASNCVYFVDYYRKPVELSTRNKCTNYIYECALCKQPIWKYNMKNHYDDMHPQMIDIPHLVEQEEKDVLRKLDI